VNWWVFVASPAWASIAALLAVGLALAIDGAWRRRRKGVDMPLDWLGKPDGTNAPPSPDAAGLVLAELRRDLERWIERAAEGSRTILALRQENARLLSECDAARREIEALRSSLEFRAASSAVGADELGSWSGLREGG